jgi:hypothetical protein
VWNAALRPSRYADLIHISPLAVFVLILRSNLAISPLAVFVLILRSNLAIRPPLFSHNAEKAYSIPSRCATVCIAIIVCLFVSIVSKRFTKTRQTY